MLFDPFCVGDAESEVKPHLLDVLLHHCVDTLHYFQRRGWVLDGVDGASIKRLHHGAYGLRIFLDESLGRRKGQTVHVGAEIGIFHCVDVLKLDADIQQCRDVGIDEAASAVSLAAQNHWAEQLWLYWQPVHLNVFRLRSLEQYRRRIVNGGAGATGDACAIEVRGLADVLRFERYEGEGRVIKADVDRDER